jgi:hypothetical protein
MEDKMSNPATVDTSREAKESKRSWLTLVRFVVFGICVVMGVAIVTYYTGRGILEDLKFFLWYFN